MTLVSIALHPQESQEAFPDPLLDPRNPDKRARAWPFPQRERHGLLQFLAVEFAFPCFAGDCVSQQTFGTFARSFSPVQKSERHRKACIAPDMLRAGSTMTWKLSCCRFLDSVWSTLVMVMTGTRHAVFSGFAWSKPGSNIFLTKLCHFAPPPL